MTIGSLEAKLNDEAFYKRCIPNFLFFSPWKKTYAQYNEADTKSVVPNYLLRKDAYGDFFYSTYAISIDGEIDNEKVEALQAFANGLELGQIRYLGSGINGFFPIHFDTGEMNEGVVLKPALAGIYIFVIANDKEQNADCPYSVIIKKGKAISKWSIPRNKI